MIADAIKERLAAAPFRPFVLSMGSGESFTVKHSELVSVSPGGRRMLLWVGDDAVVDIDVLLVESLREVSENGHRKRRSA